jgi:hypothetical protein
VPFLIELTADDAAAISHAGALLDAVGRSTSGEASLAAIHCLQAAELLTQVVPLPNPIGMSLQAGDVTVAITEALRLLSTLSEHAFALPSVVQAVDAAQRARLASAL